MYVFPIPSIYLLSYIIYINMYHIPSIIHHLHLNVCMYMYFIYLLMVSQVLWLGYALGMMTAGTRQEGSANNATSRPTHTYTAIALLYETSGIYINIINDNYNAKKYVPCDHACTCTHIACTRYLRCVKRMAIAISLEHVGT